MRVLVTGATGLIGSRLHQALRAAGHEVVTAGRRPPRDAAAAADPSTGPNGERFVAVSFSVNSSPADWHAALQGVDAVVNAAGIFREEGSARFEAVHVRGPQALFTACARAGPVRVLQISALGADENARTAYHLSKRAADETLLQLAADNPLLDATVVQPSLVFAPEGASSEVLLGLAALPLLVLPGAGRQPIQPILLDDVVAALLALLEAPPHSHAGRRIALVGPQALTFGDYLRTLRRGLGLRPTLALPVPAPLVSLAARLGDRFGGMFGGVFGGGLLDSASWQMLQRGNVADASDTRALLAVAGTAAREPARFIAAAQRSALLQRARLSWLLPLLRLALAVLWIGTAIVSFGLFPIEQSLALLARAGVPEALRPGALFGAAGLDLVLGLLTLWPPLRPSRRRWLWRAQAALIVGYSVVIALKLPEWWLHPYAPMLKNLPILALLVLLDVLEPPERTWTT
jgi:uncharacterized protein YbjT (DUF2867 family)